MNPRVRRPGGSAGALPTPSRTERCLTLILSRYPGEKIVIGKDGEITIEVKEIDRGRVRLHVSAPRDVLILRGELVGKPRPDATPPAPPTDGGAEP